MHQIYFHFMHVFKFRNSNICVLINFSHVLPSRHNMWLFCQSHGISVMQKKGYWHRANSLEVQFLRVSNIIGTIEVLVWCLGLFVNLVHGLDCIFVFLHQKTREKKVWLLRFREESFVFQKVSYLLSYVYI